MAGDVRTMSFTAPRAYRKGKGGRRWRRKSTKSPPPSSASYSFPFSLLCAQIALYPYTISLSYSGYQRMERGGPENGPARFRRFFFERKTSLCWKQLISVRFLAKRPATVGIEGNPFPFTPLTRASKRNPERLKKKFQKRKKNLAT